GLPDETRLFERPKRERDGRLRDPGPPRDLRARDRRAGPNRLQHRPLVEVLEQRRNGGGSRRRWHLVLDPNPTRPQNGDSLDFAPPSGRVAFVNFTNSPRPSRMPETARESGASSRRRFRMRRLATAALVVAVLALAAAFAAVASNASSDRVAATKLTV